MVRTCSNRGGGDRQTVRMGRREEDEKKKFTFKFQRDAGERVGGGWKERPGGGHPSSLYGISRSRFEARLCWRYSARRRAVERNRIPSANRILEDTTISRLNEALSDWFIHRLPPSPPSVPLRLRLPLLSPLSPLLFRGARRLGGVFFSS